MYQDHDRRSKEQLGRVSKQDPRANTPILLRARA